MPSKLYVKLFDLESLETLEKEIRNEFGNQGIKKVKESELSLKVKRYDLPNITWTKDDLKETSGKENYICGKEYTLDNLSKKVYGVGVKGIMHTNIKEHIGTIEHKVDIILGPRKKIIFRIEI